MVFRAAHVFRGVGMPVVTTVVAEIMIEIANQVFPEILALVAAGVLGTGIAVIFVALIPSLRQGDIQH